MHFSPPFESQRGPKVKESRKLWFESPNLCFSLFSFCLLVFFLPLFWFWKSYLSLFIIFLYPQAHTTLRQFLPPRVLHTHRCCARGRLPFMLFCDRSQPPPPFAPLNLQWYIPFWRMEASRCSVFLGLINSSKS
jgi:hypothetical protein